MSVLIVDDESELVEFLVEEISSTGIIAKEATSMLEAIALLRMDRYKVLLLDYGLIKKRCLPPCDSCELALPELWKTKIVYMSGQPQYHNQFRCTDNFLEKPFDVDKFVQIYKTTQKPF